MNNDDKDFAIICIIVAALFMIPGWIMSAWVSGLLGVIMIIIGLLIGIYGIGVGLGWWSRFNFLSKRKIGSVNFK